MLKVDGTLERPQFPKLEKLHLDAVRWLTSPKLVSSGLLPDHVTRLTPLSACPVVFAYLSGCP